MGSIHMARPALGVLKLLGFEDQIAEPSHTSHDKIEIGSFLWQET